jgi:hypothetical protein
MLRVSVYAVSTLLVAGVARLGGIADAGGATLWNYHEECQVEQCGTEELGELYGSYTEECLNEGCSTGEMSSIAGGQQYIDPMLANFLSSGWVVSASSFQSAMGPPPNAIWWYTGCQNSGMVTQQVGSLSPLPNGFNQRNQALQLGSGVRTVRVWTAPDFTGNNLSVTAPLPCFANSNPQFANAAQSAQINP